MRLVTSALDPFLKNLKYGALRGNFRRFFMNFSPADICGFVCDRRSAKKDHRLETLLNGVSWFTLFSGGACGLPSALWSVYVELRIYADDTCVWVSEYLLKSLPCNLQLALSTSWFVQTRSLTSSSSKSWDHDSLLSGRYSTTVFSVQREAASFVTLRK